MFFKIPIPKFLLILSTFLMMISFSFSNVMLTGSDNVVITELGEGSINVETDSQLINREENVKSNLNLVYEIRRVNDLSLFYKSERNISLDIFEVELIKDSFQVNSLSNGEYNLDIKVTSASGAPLTFVQKKFEVTQSDDTLIYFSTLPYLQIFYEFADGRTRYEHSFSNTGKPIEPNSDFFVKFDIENEKSSQEEVTIHYRTRHSYDKSNNYDLLKSENVILNASSLNAFRVPLRMEDAGTYDLFVEIEQDGNLISKREVRVVIGGADGTIMDVFNLNDVHQESDIANVEVQIVGPADGISRVIDSTLEMDVIVDGQVVVEQEKQIEDLSFSPTYHNFVFTAPVDLMSYKIHIILRKDDEIYDEIILDYEELNPDLVISNNGKIYNPNARMCLDDGMCSEIEKTLGNCMDCDIRVKEEDESEQITQPPISPQIPPQEDKNENSELLIAAGLVLALVAIIGIIIGGYHINKRRKK